MLDNVQKIETPEGTLIALRPASPMVRAVALLVDGMLQGALLFSFVLVASLLGQVGQGAILLFTFLMFWFYHVLFEMLMRGQSPGKRIMKLVVVRENGSPVTWESSILRNFLRVVDLLPGTYLFGLIAALTTKRFQRIGDLVAGTVVVHRESLSNGQAALAAGVPQPLTMALNLQEQRALISFAEKEQHMNEAYFIELAEILQPLTGHGGKHGADILVANAHWLVGRRQ
jgi:uncharacterized RDD family membrane protein YckC